MMFKSSSQQDGRGHMTHWIAQADSPEGTFKLVGSVFTEANYASEDPYFLFDKKRNKFFAIVKDFSHSGKLTSQFGAVGLITSADGITNWKPAENPLVSIKQFINWKGDILYVFVLNPEEGEIELPALGLSSEYAPKKIKSIRILGSNEKVKFKQDDDKLKLSVPANRVNKYTMVFEVKGAL